MYDDTDPLLARVREVCLALPEATEVESWGRPTFRAGKMFGMFTGDDEHESALLFIADPDEREALVHDPRCYLPPYFAGAGWLGLDLLVAPVDWVEVAELVETSYRRVALRRMVKALEAARTPP